MKTIYLKGTPYEIGVQIGETFSSRITRYIKYRKESLVIEANREGCQISYRDIYVLVSSILRDSSIQDFTFEELQGVADGACVDIVDVYISIGYTDILDLCMSSFVNRYDDIKFSDIKHQECTTFALCKNNILYLGQNWDMDPASSDSICLFLKHYDNGLKLLSLSTILGATHIGMSENGTAVGTANLSSTINGIGIIFPQVIQKLLMSKNKKYALNIINNKRMAGHYYYIGYSDNSCNLFETTADSFFDYYTYNDGDFLFSHTNHYLYNNFNNISNNYSVSSLERKENMDTILQKHMSLGKDNVNVEVLLNDMGNHKFGLCRHANGEDVMQTCASVLFIPFKKVAFICEGSPCKGTWEQYNLLDIFAD